MDVATSIRRRLASRSPVLPLLGRLVGNMILQHGEFVFHQSRMNNRTLTGIPRPPFPVSLAWL
jgi:hypothetical protein